MAKSTVVPCILWLVVAPDRIKGSIRHNWNSDLTRLHSLLISITTVAFIRYHTSQKKNYFFCKICLHLTAMLRRGSKRRGIKRAIVGSFFLVFKNRTNFPKKNMPAIGPHNSMPSTDPTQDHSVGSLKVFFSCTSE